MRVFRWKTICASALCAPLLAIAQQQPSDYAREKRWADEVLPSIVVGEAVWLEAPRTEKFLGIYTEAKDAKSAIILAHGLGVHPDYGLIGDLGLGLIGSVAGGWIFWALGVSAGGGLFPTAYVAFAGAVIVLVAQRKVWAHA